MEGYITKEADSGIYINPETRGSYDTGKSGAWKIWRDIPHDST